MELNTKTVIIGLVLGVVIYKIATRNKTESTSKFSSACGCGG